MPLIRKLKDSNSWETAATFTPQRCAFLLPLCLLWYSPPFHEPSKMADIQCLVQHSVLSVNNLYTWMLGNRIGPLEVSFQLLATGGGGIQIGGSHLQAQIPGEICLYESLPLRGFNRNRFPRPYQEADLR